MDMEKLFECLVAKMDANQAKAEANKKKDMEEMMADLKAWREEMAAEMKAWREDSRLMWFETSITREEMTACQEEMEADAEKMEPDS
jgi:aspartate oxidase